MTHIAVQEAEQGKAVEWLEKVTDAQYSATAAAATPNAAASAAPSDAQKAFGDSRVFQEN